MYTIENLVSDIVITMYSARVGTRLNGRSLK